MHSVINQITKRQILSDSIQVPKVMKPIESESRTVGAGQEMDDGELGFNGDSFALGRWKSAFGCTVVVAV